LASACINYVHTLITHINKQLINRLFLGRLTKGQTRSKKYPATASTKKKSETAYTWQTRSFAPTTTLLTLIIWFRFSHKKILASSILIGKE
jgi:hypothetical protein